jgi:hypothetical protein
MIKVVAPVCQRVNENDNYVAMTILKVRREGNGVQETLALLELPSFIEGNDLNGWLPIRSRIRTQCGPHHSRIIPLEEGYPEQVTAESSKIPWECILF